MIVVLPVCEKDRDAAVRNLEWARSMESSVPFSCIISTERAFDPGPIIDLASKYFQRGVARFTYAPTVGNRPWPIPQNHAWQRIARHMMVQNDSWLWWEQDAVPLRPGWLQAISDAYAASGKPFLGALGEKQSPSQPDHLNGVAVYPPNIGRYCAGIFNSLRIPFDVLGGWRVMKQAAVSPLFQHVWSWQHIPMPNREPCTFPDSTFLERLAPGAVLFHRCKDSSLIDRLKDKHRPPKRQSVSAIAGRKPAVCFHSGDLGDIIYSLLFCRTLGEIDLVLGPEPGVLVRSEMSREKFEWFAPLLRKQPFIRSVSWAPSAPKGAYNLNHFRKVWFNASRKSRRLFECYAETFQVGALPEDCAWLSVEPFKIETRPVVVNRTDRYRTRNFPWQTVATRYASRIAFVGTEEEYTEWTREFGQTAEYYPVHDALHLARIIAGAALFIGNQSFPMSLAMALNVPLIQEVSDRTPDCVFRRPSAQYSIPGPINWPELRPPDRRFVSVEPTPDGWYEFGPQEEATGLGDILTLTPLAAHLPKGVFCLTPDLDRYASLFMDLCPVRFTENPPYFRHVGGIHMAVSKLRLFGLNASPLPIVRVTDTEKVRAQVLIDNHPHPIAFCPTCSRTWEHVRGRSPEFYTPILEALTKRGYTILQFGRTDYPLLAGAVRMPFLALRELAAMYAVIGHYLGVDTGDYHLAVAVGCRATVLRPPDQEGYCPREWEYSSPRITYLPFDQSEIVKHFSTYNYDQR